MKEKERKQDWEGAIRLQCRPEALWQPNRELWSKGCPLEESHGGVETARTLYECLVYLWLRNTLQRTWLVISAFLNHWSRATTRTWPGLKSWCGPEGANSRRLWVNQTPHRSAVNPLLKRNLNCASQPAMWVLYCKYLLPLCACLFTLLIVSFDEQKSLIWM